MKTKLEQEIIEGAKEMAREIRVTAQYEHLWHKSDELLNKISAYESLIENRVSPEAEDD